MTALFRPLPSSSSSAPHHDHYVLIMPADMGVAALCFAPVFASLALLSHPITPYIGKDHCAQSLLQLHQPLFCRVMVLGPTFIAPMTAASFHCGFLVCSAAAVCFGRAVPHPSAMGALGVFWSIFNAIFWVCGACKAYIYVYIYVFLCANFILPSNF
mgnify:CR=1 FL=1